MSPEELYALLSTSPAGIRGAENAPLVAARTPLALIEANSPAPQRVPLQRTGGTRQFIYPGFGMDPELQAGTGGNTVPPGGSYTGGGGGGTTTPTSYDLSIPGGSGSGGGLGGASTAGLTMAALGALLKVAPWLAKQLGLTDSQAAQLTGPGGMNYADLGTVAGSGDLGSTLLAGSGELAPAGVSALPWDQLGASTGSGLGIFTPDVNPPTIGNPNTLTPDIPDWLDNGSIGAPGTGGTAPPPDSGTTTGGEFPDTGADPGSDIGNVFTTGSSGYSGGFWDPAAGAGEWAGTGADIGGSFSGPLIDPGSLGIPDASFDLAGFNIDPFSMAGGAIGTYLGGKMAAASVRGDEQQGWASKAGGLAGGALGTAILPGIGTLVGALLGSNLAGQLGAGEPDDPWSGFDGGVFYGDQGPAFATGGTYAQNGGKSSQATALRDWLTQAINSRAASEGYTVNPEMVNQPGFSAGFYNRPTDQGYNDPLFFRWRAPGEGAKPEEATWRGTNDATGRQGLLDTAWGALTQNNYFVKPGSVDRMASWDQVKQQLQARGNDTGWTADGEGNQTPVADPKTWQQQTYRPAWDNGQELKRVDGQAGYETQEYVDQGEAGGFTNTTWHAGAPPESSGAPQGESAAPPVDQSYYNGSAAREGGLIPPTPGGTQPVPLTAHSGEFVIRPEAVQQFGPEMLTAINRGTFPEMPEAGETDMVEGAENMMGGGTGEDGDGMDGDEGMGMGMMGEDGDGLDGDENMGPWSRPYANEAKGPSPFERLSATGDQADPMATIRDLPPPVQQAMLASLGADPLLASAWLKVLGPRYQEVIAQALRQGGAMRAGMAQGMPPGQMPPTAPGAPIAPGAMM